jgi:hypothetical protein
MPADDPYTKLLLHCDGAHLSTTLIDECGKTVTRNGPTCLLTGGIRKFGNSSLYLGGDSSYLSFAASSDFNMQAAGDWTVDFWFNPMAIDARAFAHFVSGVGGANKGLHIHLDELNIVVDDGMNASGLSAGNIILYYEWNHLAVVRESGTLKIYLNGVMIDSEAAQDYGDADSTLLIGRYLGGGSMKYFWGFFDEFRVSKGIARWTANFTPPTRPYAIYKPYLIQNRNRFRATGISLG